MGTKYLLLGGVWTIERRLGRGCLYRSPKHTWHSKRNDSLDSNMKSVIVISRDKQSKPRTKKKRPVEFKGHCFTYIVLEGIDP